MPSAGFSVKRRCELFSILCQHTGCRTKACPSLIYHLQGKALIEHYHTWQQSVPLIEEHCHTWQYSVPLIEEHCHTRQRCQSLLCHRGGGVGTADGKRSNALCTALGRTGTYTLHSCVHSSASYTAVFECTLDARQCNSNARQCNSTGCREHHRVCNHFQPCPALQRAVDGVCASLCSWWWSWSWSLVVLELVLEPGCARARARAWLCKGWC